jgi:hypothetical protein
VGILDKLRSLRWPAAEHVLGDDPPAEVTAITDKQDLPGQEPGPAGLDDNVPPLTG